eukprot:COSAG01_NODE_14515_length_1444_cov_93.742007_2_plen_383_part_00
MMLCDETLEARMQRKGLADCADRRRAAHELCAGLSYLHTLPEAVTHRDLKPSNLLFKGECLKIADMGQSRILAMGETAVQTGSQGGTMGWMSPEEIEWDNGGSLGGAQFQAHLSGDVHSAGSIVFYILSGGVHCFGSNGLRQQVSIVEGTPDFAALREDVVAVDLVARMVCLEPAARLKIAQVLAHPFFWSDSQRIEKIRGWKTSWRRGRDLDRRLTQHQRNVQAVCGSEGGWLSRLDAAVTSRLQAWRHGFDGSDPLELVRAIRNVHEHWFDEQRDDAAEAERVEVVSATFSSFMPSIWTEISLCHAWSCQAIEDGKATAGDGADRLEPGGARVEAGAPLGGGAGDASGSGGRILPAHTLRLPGASAGLRVLQGGQFALEG